MLSIYVPQGGNLEQRAMDSGEGIPEAAIWIDLVNPTYEEDKLVESLVGVSISTHCRMPSSISSASTRGAFVFCSSIARVPP